MSTNFSLPMRVISYYASTRSPIDKQDSYNYWMRSKLVRIICNKPFARGDVLEIQSIRTTNNGVLITTKLIEEWQQEYPVLSFVSGRLVYNKSSVFEHKATDGIQILSPIEQILSNSYSFGLILAVYKSGKISCVDKVCGNKLDIIVGLNWQ